MRAEASIREHIRSKAPRATLGFWIVKILANALGATSGDALAMQLNLGHLAAAFVFMSLFLVTLAAQLSASRFRPLLYWACVVAMTAAGTTMSGYSNRTLGLAPMSSSAVLLAGVIAILLAWRQTSGALAAERITRRSDEAFYWGAILVCNALGLALGAFNAGDIDLGFSGSVLLFGGMVITVVLMNFFTTLPKVLLFWAAYVLTTPLGATVGDTLTKPFDAGGLNLSGITASLLIAAAMIPAVWFTERRQAQAAARLQHQAGA